MSTRSRSVSPLRPGDVQASLLSRSLHPHLEVFINSTIPNSDPGPCAAHLHFSFLDSVFIDRDELLDIWSSDMQPSSGPLQWTLSPEVIDIERPVRPGASDVGLGVILGLQNGQGKLDVPLHARYLAPREHGYDTLSLLEHGRLKGGVVCGKESHIMLQARDLSEVPVEPLTLSLPTGKMAHQPFVELGTTAAIWLGFAWLAYRILLLGRRMDAARPANTKTLLLDRSRQGRLRIVTPLALDQLNLVLSSKSVILSILWTEYVRCSSEESGSGGTGHIGPWGHQLRGWRLFVAPEDFHLRTRSERIVGQPTWHRAMMHSDKQTVWTPQPSRISIGVYCVVARKRKIAVSPIDNSGVIPRSE